jgi:hypothetical protein
MHQNQSTDPGYQEFLRPVAEAVLRHETPGQRGLDYGSGQDSALLVLLADSGLILDRYDPLFFSELRRPTGGYDFVTCTEVIEHFENPVEEFLKISELLANGGRLYLRTELTDQVRDFPGWHYHRDPTHVSFWSSKSLEVIAHRTGLRLDEVHEKKFILMSRPDAASCGPS